MLALPVVMSASRLRAAEDASASVRASIWDQSHKIRFILHDALEHPFYWWPRTLSQPIQSSFKSPIDLNRLVLTRADTGERVPFQFSEVQHTIRPGFDGSATLNFFSDLPSGAHFEFVLSRVANSAGCDGAAGSRESHEGNTIVLDSGPMRVRIPATQQVLGDAPGPIIQISRGRSLGWCVDSEIVGDRVTHITSTRVENGPLFIAYELTYETEEGSRFPSSSNAGMDFVRFAENMDGLRPGRRGRFTSTWNGFDVTHRQAPNHPFPLPTNPQYDDYAWERIDEPGASTM